ncbi:hypothetical protein PR048_024733 [Dryococelus australis]|uniref:Uncharacterized protein n=1 Tax=Dryococelus australis TaxID=614101 RepID=A0ABQ9GPC5_9NEOP|nr:hypothetical protein PR048_024733 [Dryococelus australis]
MTEGGGWGGGALGLLYTPISLALDSSCTLLLKHLWPLARRLAWELLQLANRTIAAFSWSNFEHTWKTEIEMTGTGIEPPIRPECESSRPPLCHIRENHNYSCREHPLSERKGFRKTRDEGPFCRWLADYFLSCADVREFSRVVQTLAAAQSRPRFEISHFRDLHVRRTCGNKIAGGSGTPYRQQTTLPALVVHSSGRRENYGMWSAGDRYEVDVLRLQRVQTVHDKVSTLEINHREISLHLPAYILTGALSGMRPVKFVKMDGKTMTVLSQLNVIHKANELKTSDFRVWESCRTMPLVGWFSRISPVSGPFHSGAAPSSSALNTPMGHVGVVVKLLASHLGVSGSNPSGVAPVSSHVEIVPDDATGRRVFSGISRFPRPCIPALLRTQLTSPSSILKISMLRAAQISPLTH